MPKKTTKTRFGKRPPSYTFALNPYPDLRFTTCPQCGAKTGQRKLPLLIHVDPATMIALNYTNRYCKHCDLLIGHQHEIEHLLTEMFRRMDPGRIGNDYLIIGTVEKPAWRAGMKQPTSLEEMRAHVSDFKQYEELRMTRGGWYPEDQEPPIMEPAEPTEWVKG